MIAPINNVLPAGHRAFPLLERTGLPQPLAEGKQILFSLRYPENGSDSGLSCGVSVAELATLTLTECCRHLDRGFDPVLTTSIVVRLYDPYYESKKFEIPSPLPGGFHTCGAIGFLISREYTHFWKAESGYAETLLDDVYLYQLRELDDGTWKAVIGGSHSVLAASSKCRGLLRGD